MVTSLRSLRSTPGWIISKKQKETSLELSLKLLALSIALPNSIWKCTPSSRLRVPPSWGHSRNALYSKPTAGCAVVLGGGTLQPLTEPGLRAHLPKLEIKSSSTKGALRQGPPVMRLWGQSSCASGEPPRSRPGQCLPFPGLLLGSLPDYPWLQYSPVPVSSPVLALALPVQPGP